VAKRHKSGETKRRTREHVIADLAVNHVERHVLLAGNTMQKIANDYGLDEIIRTFNDKGEVEPGLVWLQIKATDHPQERKGKGAIAVRLEYRDVIHWMKEQYPVILVVYDATRDKAHWLHMQKALRDGGIFKLAKSGERLVVHVPVEQTVHEEAIRAFRRFKLDAETAWKEGARCDG
jgi:hypothetical protein